MKTLKNLFWTLILFAVIGNVLFVVEFFYPLGEVMINNFGKFGELIGHLLGIITFCVDVTIVSIFLSVKLKNRL